MKWFYESEWKSWSEIRKQGIGFYILRWIVSSAAFIFVIDGFLLLTTERIFELENIYVMLSLSIFMGVLVSLMRWRVFERKHNKNNETIFESNS